MSSPATLRRAPLAGAALLHLLVVPILMSAPLPAQELDSDVARLLRRSDVNQALREIGVRHEQVLSWQRALARIPAPTGDEGARARFVQRQFQILGLEDIGIDGMGNVLGSWPRARVRPRILLTAHLDTVFPAGTPLEHDWFGPRLVGPGVHDNARGIAVLLGAAEAFVRAGPLLNASVVFACTVGEEGLGDLRGMKELFRPGGAAEGVDYVINVDGPGLDRIVNRGLGSRRYRVTYRGPGGHSWNDFGLVNPANALGRAITRLASIPLPSSPRSSLNVGRVGGGTSVNTIPQEAWMEVDIRSEAAETLMRVEREAMDALVDVLREEREVHGDDRLELDAELVGDRPAGALPPNALLVRAVRAVTRALGVEPALSVSSTDANVPLALGVPAVSLGGGGVGGRAHSPEEWFDAAEAQHGVERVFLLALLLGSLQEV
ncbi:MAG: M20/M25/M40 family metallo-hydrolase [Gemmatimonadetes bacterium]|nr:M20/M25/M40 family metallo-hydrolase [Gemmatimonadota bacterium]